MNIAWWHRFSAPTGPQAVDLRKTAATARIFTIFEGTSEIQRMLIGRAVTGLDVR